MADTDSPVYYLLPDGTKVSNDPRFLAQAQDKEIDLSSSSAETGDGLDKLTGEELKAKLAELTAAGVEVDTKGVKTKADLVARIRAAQNPS